MAHHITKMADITYGLSDGAVQALNSALNVTFTAHEYTMIFFLVSKSEHNNEDPKKTFMCANGESVWTYAEPLQHDWRQRGCTIGVVGFTTANSSKAAWGDAQPMLRTFRRMGGPDLLRLTDDCHKDKAAAHVFCSTIHSLSETEVELLTRAQLQQLASRKGYLFEAVRICRELDLPIKPLLIAAFFDSLLNFGIGGTYCPLTWLVAHAKRGSKTKTLRRFLRWKRKVGSLNSHNSCKHNARNRSDMFKQLLRKKAWSLDEQACRKVVRWRMK